MTAREAAGVINGNFFCEKGSFIYKLYERERFSKKRFWELYDCIIALAENAASVGVSAETARRITAVYQNFLKMMVYHFDKNDLAGIKKLPKDHYKYIDLLDTAVGAYFTGIIPDESIFGLKRSKP